MESLAGKTAVITGAASGIGLALTSKCAAAGMSVGMVDVDEEMLEKAAARFQAEGARVTPFVTDVASAEEMRALSDRAEAALGPVHLLVNNAGVGTIGVRIWELTLPDWQWVLGVNLQGTIHGLSVFLPAMVERDEGHVVNTASAAGLLSPAGLGPYNASKHAIVTLSETLRHELRAAGSRVGVTLVCPGLVRTRMADNERNRSRALANPARVRREREEKYAAARQAMQAATERGRDPVGLADTILEAVRTNRFYVIPDAWILDAVTTRLTDILESREPTEPS